MSDATNSRLSPRPTGRNLVAAAGVTVLAVLAFVVPHWPLRYAAALAIFCIWMGWFVESLAVWLGSQQHPAFRDDD